MPDIAYLISADVAAPDRPGARADAYEVALQRAAIDGPCAAQGVRLAWTVWDDPAFDPERFDAVVIGPAWDYARKPAAFAAALDGWARARPVLNPPGVVRWNMDKRYLADLAEAGAPTIPTLWVEAADAARIAPAFDALATDAVVVKPVVGAGAWRQAKLTRGGDVPDPDDLPPGAAMIQPFLPAVAEEGEYSFLFFGGAFSHALVKRPAAGDYRVQSIYGGREETHDPSTDDLALARRCLSAAQAINGVGDLLYARVDMARGPDGRLALMELELIEPYYYPRQGPEVGRLFADALSGALARTLDRA